MALKPCVFAHVHQRRLKPEGSIMGSSTADPAAKMLILTTTAMHVVDGDVVPCAHSGLPNLAPPRRATSAKVSWFSFTRLRGWPADVLCHTYYIYNRWCSRSCAHVIHMCSVFKCSDVILWFCDRATFKTFLIHPFAWCVHYGMSNSVRPNIWF